MGIDTSNSQMHVQMMTELLFENNGLHLSGAGNEIFLNAICAAVGQFKIN